MKGYGVLAAEGAHRGDPRHEGVAALGHHQLSRHSNELSDTVVYINDGGPAVVIESHMLEDHQILSTPSSVRSTFAQSVCGFKSGLEDMQKGLVVI